MSCLRSKMGFNDIHGSFDTCFENAMGKLVHFGVKKGMAELDAKCVPFFDWLKPKKNVLSTFLRDVVASFLSLAGYYTEPLVKDFLIKRIDTLYEFIKKRSYSIYAKKDEYKGIPKPFKDYPLINPELYPDGNFRLPWIHDINGFTGFSEEIKDKNVKRKINDIISYILNPKYQQFPDGYGIVMAEPRKYYGMGWSVWLPGYYGFDMSPFKAGCLIQRIEMMSHFAVAWSHRWFNESLHHLENFKADRGTYLFPKEYLKEKRNSYFITGAHMGLGENRRKKLSLEIESTFWMMRIKKNIGFKSV